MRAFGWALSVPGSKQNHLLFGSLDFDAVGFDARIIFESLVNDTSIKSVQRFQLDHITPATNFFSRFFGLFHQRIPGLSPVAADIHHHFGGGRILLEEQAIGDVLQIGKGLTLASDQSARVVSFDIKQDTIFHTVFLDGDRETK